MTVNAGRVRKHRTSRSPRAAGRSDRFSVLRVIRPAAGRGATVATSEPVLLEVSESDDQRRARPTEFRLRRGPHSALEAGDPEHISNIIIRYIWYYCVSVRETNDALCRRPHDRTESISEPLYFGTLWLNFHLLPILGALFGRVTSGLSGLGDSYRSEHDYCRLY